MQHGESDKCVEGGCGVLRVTLEGEEVELLASRAAVWRRGVGVKGGGGLVGCGGWGGDVLLVSDLHLGKADAMRSFGSAVPAEAILRDELSRLEAAILTSGVSRVLVLGDLLHAPAGLSEMLVQTVKAWVEATGVTLEVIPGNHDRCLGRVAAAWKLVIHPPLLEEGPFMFTHDGAGAGGPFVWGGHVHPAVIVRNGGDRIRLPAFVVGPGAAILPAFSRFTAGVPMRTGGKDRVFGVCEGKVLEIRG